MPITLTLQAETPAELENLLQGLFQPQVYGQGLRDTVIQQVAAQNKEAAASEPAAPAPRTRASRAKKAPEPVAAEQPQVPEFLQEKPYPVYKASGEKFSDFKDADKALDRLRQEALACTDLDALNALTANNMDTVEKFPEDLQNTYQEFIDDRYNDLQPSEEGEEEEEITLAVVETEVKAFVRAKGLMKAKEIFQSLGVSGVPAMKPEQYPVLVRKLRAAAAV